MTVKELRDVLAAFEDDAPVLVSGYEDGYDDPDKVKLVKVCGSPRTGTEGWWSGSYDDAQDAHGRPTFYAVVIPR